MERTLSEMKAHINSCIVVDSNIYIPLFFLFTWAINMTRELNLIKLCEIINTFFIIDEINIKIIYD